MVLTSRAYAFTIPAYVIMMRPELTCVPLRRTVRDLVPRLRCVPATRKADVTIVRNGSASFLVSAKGSARWRVLYHWPPVHHKVFAVGQLEIAILASHLRAIGMGKASGEKAFAVFEEDAEWAMLLGMAHGTLRAHLASLPHHWSILQAAVIAEGPYMRHLHKRLHVGSHQISRGMVNGHSLQHQHRHQLSHQHQGRRRVSGLVAGGAAMVPRAMLRGLSWPFTPGREVVENASWLKPYWSAACYIVSARGAAHLLTRYWPGWPRHAGVVVDTRSQRWPAADQLLFNISHAFIMPPLLTQPITGAHAEHIKYKRGARDFVFATWRKGWQPLSDSDLTRVPIALYALTVNVNHHQISQHSQHSQHRRMGVEAASVKIHGTLQARGRASMPTSHGNGISAWCREVLARSIPATIPPLPAHTFVRAESFGRAIEHALSLAAEDLAADEKVENGAPTHALLLSMPILKFDSSATVAEATPIQGQYVGGLADALVQISLRHLLPGHANGTHWTTNAPEGHRRARFMEASPSASDSLAASSDGLVFTLSAEHRHTKKDHRLSCLMGAAVQHSSLPRHLAKTDGSSGSRLCTPKPPCMGWNVAGVLVRIQSIPALLRASRNGAFKDGAIRCQMEGFSSLLSLITKGPTFRFLRQTVHFSGGSADLHPLDDVQQWMRLHNKNASYYAMTNLTSAARRVCKGRPQFK